MFYFRQTRHYAIATILPEREFLTFSFSPKALQIIFCAGSGHDDLVFLFLEEIVQIFRFANMAAKHITS